MKLEIITPEQILFTGEVTTVTLPGTKGSFTVLENHAPIISSLMEGLIKYEEKGVHSEMIVTGGFVEVSRNVISVCIEII